MMVRNELHLPQNFADKLIELESLLEDQRSMDLITELNELYRIGIDYYIQFQPRKAQHFQRKMTRLLADPATLFIIQSRSPQKIQKLKSSHMASRCKISQQVNKFKSCENEYVKNIMQHSEKAILKNQNIKQMNLNKQEEMLQNRLKLKKCRSQQRILISIDH